MKRKAKRLWKRANSMAGCRCATGDGLFFCPEITPWMAEHEYWHESQPWHLIAASLLLDGIDSKDLP